VGARVVGAVGGLGVGAGGNRLYGGGAVGALLRDPRVGVEHGVGEVVGGVAAPAPPISLRAAIDSRLRSLPPQVLPLVRLAALLGAEFATGDLATVAGRPVTGGVGLVGHAGAGGGLGGAGARRAGG